MLHGLRWKGWALGREKEELIKFLIRVANSNSFVSINALRRLLKPNFLEKAKQGSPE